MKMGQLYISHQPRQSTTDNQPFPQLLCSTSILLPLPNISNGKTMKGTSLNNKPNALIEDVLELTPALGLGSVLLHLGEQPHTLRVEINKD